MVRLKVLAIGLGLTVLAACGLHTSAQPYQTCVGYDEMEGEEGASRYGTDLYVTSESCPINDGTPTATPKATTKKKSREQLKRERLAEYKATVAAEDDGLGY
jgi:hypothetical protein